MRFTSITISNYRQYKNLTFDFTKKRDTDIHIIVASNGTGKTNLLNAINWCLYNDEPHLNNKDEAMIMCNKSALKEAKERGQETVDVSVTIEAETNSERVIFCRNLPFKALTAFPLKSRATFTVSIVTENGTEPLEGEAAQDYIDLYLPKRIREYFFFDGEQLDNYFDPQKFEGNSSAVRDSIHTISEINVVTDAIKHLKKVIDDYRREAAKNNPDIVQLKNTYDSKKLLREAKEKEISDITAAIAVSKEKIEEYTTKISSQESIVDIDKSYKENEAEIEKKKTEYQYLKFELKRFVRKYYVLLSTYDTNRRVYNYIDEKSNQGHLPPDIDLKLLKQSLESHICAVCNQGIESNSAEHIEHLMQKLTVSTAVSHKLMEIKNDLITATEAAENFCVEKEEIFRKLSEKKSEISDLENKNLVLRKKLSTCSDVAEIKDWVKKRDDHTNLVQINSEKLGKYKEQVKVLQEDEDKARNELDKALSQQEKGEELKEYMQYASEGLHVLNEIEQEITGEVRCKMQEETMRVFSSLIWKKNTYERIELNDNYQLHLYSVENESCIGSTSAAERELLALAFTIALHRVSGHDALLFIDTPVGRVSDVNRENFAQALIDVSRDKQLILAFTPSEFSAEIRGYFNDESLSSMVELENLTEEETKVRRNY